MRFYTHPFIASQSTTAEEPTLFRFGTVRAPMHGEHHRITSSSRLARFVLHARVGRDPVELPGLATVVGKSLLEVAGVLRDIRDDEAHENRAAVQGVARIELAAAVLEFADRRDRQRADLAIGEVET